VCVLCAGRGERGEHAGARAAEKLPASTIHRQTKGQTGHAAKQIAAAHHWQPTHAYAALRTQ